MNNVWNTINNIANKLHPIGSVYISQNPTDPSELFGGTWERIYDRVIMAAGTKYKLGYQGDPNATKKSYTLTLNNLPTHYHAYGINYTTAVTGNHQHTVEYNGCQTSVPNIDNTYVGASYNPSVMSTVTSESGAHQHQIVIGPDPYASNANSPNTGGRTWNSGNGSPTAVEIETLNPYYGCYAWVRIG